MSRNARIDRLLEAIPRLTDYRLELLEDVVSALGMPHTFWRIPQSDIVIPSVLDDFGDILRLHHCFSREPFSKDKFEHAMERALLAGKINAKLAPRGQKGFDLSIRDERFSLKTEAAKGISVSKIHISKFMELGGGEWGSNPADLVGLRGQFLAVLDNIQRILVLRCLRKGDPSFLYELVEIPKDLLEMASTGELEMKLGSSQNPKPGYCYAPRKVDSIFELYFDGGGERKLQVKNLPKSRCRVHATWEFSAPEQLS